MVTAGTLRLLVLGGMASLPADLQNRFKVIGSSQHGFTEGKSCLASLIAFYDKMASSADWVRAVDILS